MAKESISSCKKQDKTRTGIFRSQSSLDWYKLTEHTRHVLNRVITSAFKARLNEMDSGKGDLTSFAVELLAGNAIICNADDYRDLHPRSDEIKISTLSFTNFCLITGLTSNQHFLRSII